MGETTMTNVNRAIKLFVDAIDKREHDDVDYCDQHATEICDTCGALLCNDHVIIGNTVVVDGVEIPYTYCRKFACINVLKTVNIVPYITCA